MTTLKRLTAATSVFFSYALIATATIFYRYHKIWSIADSLSSVLLASNVILSIILTFHEVTFLKKIRMCKQYWSSATYKAASFSFQRSVLRDPGDPRLLK